MLKPRHALTAGWIAASLLASPWTSAASKFQIHLDEGRATSNFVAIGNPTAIRIRGTMEKPKGRILADASGLSGAITVAVASFDTGISLRNQHMKEKYLEASKHPEVTFTPTRIDSLDGILKDPAFTGKGLAVEGRMKIHGVEKPVKGQAAITRKGDSVTGTFQLKLNIRDFEIDVPTFAGVTVANEVEVTVDFTAPFKGQE